MWREDQGTDVTSAFLGLQIPPRELYDEIQQRGWTVSNVGIKDNQYAAEATNPHGEKIEKVGPNEATALGAVLMAIQRRETIRYQSRTAAWKNNWAKELEPIAHAYSEAPVYDPKAAGAWKDLADDCLKRANMISQQIRVEPTADPEPYKTVDEMCQDVREKQHIYISTASLQHPIWSTDEVMAYRLVHDVLGHCASGGDWGWTGENLATAAQMPVLNPEAQRALFAESIGRTAYNVYFQAFGPQKICYLDEELEKVREGEQDPGHGGVHPSQTIVPGQVPTFGGDKQSAVRRHSSADPNLGWQSQVEPLPDNAYLWQREMNGLDPLDAAGVGEHAAYLDSGWHGLQHPDGTPDLPACQQAIANAFRAVLLGGRKPFQQNACHYQDLMSIPATTSDPIRYWNTLENKREAHNQARGLPEGFHQQPYAGELQQMLGWIKGMHPELHDGQVQDLAQRELFHMLAEEEERITGLDDGEEMTAQQVEAEAAAALHDRLNTMTKPRVDEKYDHGNFQLFAAADGGYGSFLVSHLRPIGAVSTQIPALTDAAHEDIANGGKGHYFRNAALNLNLPGVGPKDASYAWMLLAPRTSQLGVIDPKIHQLLGYQPEDMSDRDYFKYERELAAGRDAAGYSHLPLGQFSWGLWDASAFGPGGHRDHSPLKPIDPAPYEEYDWDSQPRPMEQKYTPYWWTSTQQARDQVARDWDHGVAVNFPRETIPKLADAAFSTFVPFYNHPNGTSGRGTAGQPLMQFLRESLGLNTEDIWSLGLEAGKLNEPKRPGQLAPTGPGDSGPQGAPSGR